MAGHIFAYEVVDNGRFEEFSLVGNDVLDAQTTAQILRVVEILRAAILLVKAEGYARHFVSGILQQQGRHRAVRTATHSQQNSLFRLHSCKDSQNIAKVITRILITDDKILRQQNLYVNLGLVLLEEVAEVEIEIYASGDVGRADIET